MLLSVLKTLVRFVVPVCAAAMAWAESGSPVPVMELVRTCAPFADEITAVLNPKVSDHTTFLLRGRQALIFGTMMCNEGPTIVKFVGRQHTEAKPTALQRPFVESCRREVDFFKAQREHGFDLSALFPRVSMALATPVGECCSEAFVLVMEDLEAAGFSQPPSLQLKTASSVLGALAALHAHFWANADVMAGSRGSFWALERRPSEEMDPDAAQQRWATVVSAFAGECRDLPQFLGRDLALAARDLDAVVSSTAVTLIHGDAKPANLFTNPDKSSVKLIDMQWCGKGNPLSDVTYFLCTSLDAALLKADACHNALAPASVEDDDAAAEGVFSHLIEHYLAALGARLGDSRRNQLQELARTSLDVCFLDYVRVVYRGPHTHGERER